MLFDPDSAATITHCLAEERSSLQRTIPAGFHRGSANFGSSASGNCTFDTAAGAKALAANPNCKSLNDLGGSYGAEAFRSLENCSIAIKTFWTFVTGPLPDGAGHLVKYIPGWYGGTGPQPMRVDFTPNVPCNGYAFDPKTPIPLACFYSITTSIGVLND